MDKQFDKTMNRRFQGSCKWDIALQAVGNYEDTLALSTADTDFPTAPAIREALRDAADNAALGYTNPTAPFYEAVISWMQRRHSWTIEKDWIVGTAGVVAAMHYFLNGCTQPTDAVIIQPPVYPPFSRSVLQTGRTLVANPLLYEDGKYRMDFDDLEKKAERPDVKMMFLCSPHNPVGRCWTYEELERVAKICVKHDVILVSDEVHFDIVLPPHKHTVLGTLPRQLIKNAAVCTSPSKSFNVAGMQLSNIVIPNKELRQQFVAEQHRSGSFLLNALSYIICTAAYNESEEWFDSQLAYIAGNNRFIVEELAKQKHIFTMCPLEATYLQWLDFSSTLPSAQERQNLVREKLHICFDSGPIFGKEGEHFERFNIACPQKTVKEVLNRLLKLRNISSC